MASQLGVTTIEHCEAREDPETPTRRAFIARMGALLGGSLAMHSAGARAPAGQEASVGRKIDYPTDLRITKITEVDIVGDRPKMIGKNAVRDDHGQRCREHLVRLYTNDGHHGFGVGRPKEDTLRALVGKNPFDFFEPAVGIRDAAGTSGVKEVEFALWDLIGRVLEKPVYQLIADPGSAAAPGTPVRAYDGSLYFADILYPEKGVARIEEEAAESVRLGFRAIKAKIGRGNKWMDPEEGFARDVAVLKAVRRVIGRDALLLIDANNGYDRAGAMRLLDAVGDVDIYFAEEMFPEDVPECLEFKRFMRERGWRTKLADGEGLRTAEDFRPYLETEAFDVVQGDMRRFGFTEYKRLSRLAAEHNAVCAPHNWGSQFGAFAGVQLAGGIPNFLFVEVDPVVFDVYVMDALQFKDGAFLLPDAPGLGVQLDEAVYQQKYEPKQSVYE